MNLKFLQRFSAGVLGLGLLIGCGGAVGIGDEGLTPISEVPITEAVTTVVDAPTTTAFIDTRPACSMSAVDPNETNPIGQTVDGLNLIRCIGDWMITQNFPDCGECEGVTPFHIEDNAWKMYDPIYIYCYSVPDDYGPDPEGAAIADSFIFTTLQIAVAGYPCDETNKGYRPESMTEPLMFGDTGPRVTALQQALSDIGFFLISVDGAYGPETISAVMDFQWYHLIPTDGIAGSRVHELLGIAYP
jgi:hypothetical protein